MTKNQRAGVMKRKCTMLLKRVRSSAMKMALRQARAMLDKHFPSRRAAR